MKEPQERRRNANDLIIIAAISLAVLSILLAFALSLAELRSNVALRRSFASARGKIKAASDEEGARKKPKVGPLKLLPPRLPDYLTNARHGVPGQEDFAAEAIYQPKSEELSLKTPLNVYVRIAYHGARGEANRAIASISKERFPAQRAEIEINGRKALTGYDATYGSYFIGWTLENYSIGVDAT